MVSFLLQKENHAVIKKYRAQRAVNIAPSTVTR